MKRVKEDADKFFRKLKPKEMIWILFMVILIILLSVKSIYLDPYKPITVEDSENLSVANAFVKEHYDGFLYRNNILDVRVIKLRTEDDALKVQLRKYVFGFFPFGDQYLIIEN